MAITFENNNSSNNRIVIIILLIIAALAVAGFVAWKMSSGALSSAPFPRLAADGIDDNILIDARVGSLELFPQIPAAPVAAGKKNPFVESAPSAYSTSTSVSTAANVLAPGAAGLPQLGK